MLSLTSDFASDFTCLLLFVIEIKEKERKATLTLGDGERGTGGGAGWLGNWDGNCIQRLIGEDKVERRCFCSLKL